MEIENKEIKINGVNYIIKKYKNPAERVTPYYLKQQKEFKQSSGIFKVKTKEQDGCKEMFSITLYTADKVKQVYFLKFFSDGKIDVMEKYRAFETEKIDSV